MSQAEFLVVPSLWIEGFTMVIVEAFAHGLPVICQPTGRRLKLSMMASLGCFLPLLMPTT